MSDVYEYEAYLTSWILEILNGYLNERYNKNINQIYLNEFLKWFNEQEDNCIVKLFTKKLRIFCKFGEHENKYKFCQEENRRSTKNNIFDIINSLTFGAKIYLIFNNCDVDVFKEIKVNVTQETLLNIRSLRNIISHTQNIFPDLDKVIKNAISNNNKNTTKTMIEEVKIQLNSLHGNITFEKRFSEKIKNNDKLK